MGRWREEWPGTGQIIDASTVWVDGTPFQDITDFKAWLVEHVDVFAQCLSEKLMAYATGRIPNYSERKEISQIVRKNLRQGQGFRDLVFDLIESETFFTK